MTDEELDGLLNLLESRKTEMPELHRAFYEVTRRLRDLIQREQELFEFKKQAILASVAMTSQLKRMMEGTSDEQGTKDRVASADVGPELLGPE